VAPVRVFIGSPTWLSSCQGSNLAANPPKPFQDWFLANESHVSFFVVNNGRKTLLECTFNHPVNEREFADYFEVEYSAKNDR
jgi:hypothetical protein